MIAKLLGHAQMQATGLHTRLAAYSVQPTTTPNIGSIGQDLFAEPAERVGPASIGDDKEKPGGTATMPTSPLRNLLQQMSRFPYRKDGAASTSSARKRTDFLSPASVRLIT